MRVVEMRDSDSASRLLAQLVEHGRAERLQRVAADRLARRDLHEVAVLHAQHAAAHGDRCSAPASSGQVTTETARSVTKSACCGRMPKRPVASSARTEATSSASTAISSGVMTCSFMRVTFAAAERLLLRRGVRQRADHIERGLVPLVGLAGEDRLAALERLLERHGGAGLAGELRGDREGLGQEAHQPARALHGAAVVARKLVHAEQRDDLLQLAIALDQLAAILGEAVVALADDARVEHDRGRGRAGRWPDRAPGSPARGESTIAESRCEKMVATAGSVKSSAGT